MPKPKLVTIFGGSGFVGRYIAWRMARHGWRVRVACRHPNQAGFVRTYGVVGQVEPVFCNIRDDESVRRVINGSNVVVNCVGLLTQAGKNTFAAIQAEGADRIARLTAQHGVDAFVHVSAIGADPDSESAYSRTKAEGEAAVRRHMPDAVILRPSVIFGPEDDFFNRFGSMARLSPFLPVVGAKTKFQPVYVDDVAKAAEMAVLGEVAPGTLQLGGPDVQTFRELMVEMLKIIRRRRLIVNVPFGVAGLMGRGLGLVQTATKGLIVNSMLTVDQVRDLQHDNVVADGARGFAELGIDPAATEAVLPEYLWRFRPGGQYEAQTESAGNLRF